MPSACTRVNPHRCTRNRESVGEKPDQCIIGRAIDGWSSHSDFDRIVVNAHALRGGRSRLDMNGQDRSILGVLHDRQIHPCQGLEDRLHQFPNATLHIRIVGDRSGNRDVTSSIARHALPNEGPGIDQ